MPHVVVPYPASNSSVRTRALHWIDRAVAAGRVARDGVEIHGPGFVDGLPRRSDRLLLLRNARKLTRGRTEQRLLSNAALGVYDLDDGLPWDDGRLPGLGRWWKRPFPRSLLAERAASAADRVIAGNDVIAEWANGLCGDVRVIPTCVEPSDYRPRTSWELDETPVIGWIGSTATEPYLAAIAPALSQVVRSSGARLEIVSGPGTTDAALQPFSTRVPWDDEANHRVGGWDIGIMPLADGVYERAKCAHKLLQYAASGLPAVASPVGVNRPILDAMDGLAATTHDDWVEALTALLTESADRRSRRAARGFDVAERYSYERWQAQWLDAVGW